ncbi:hypothetical protein FOC4_g10007434 [Fusarium odoratissimum]|uniref:Uncharacterized protein n=1 Tax=Fusarium oxysporum f. sp. cubense (strain race 4) TaxID=2502994 RepID=N1RGY5_FUSC4|nr:hypothetical protein FOC4_g10007434 [Fusarium odoratissimum]
MSSMEKDRIESDDQTMSSEEAPRRERRSKKKGSKRRQQAPPQQQQQQGGSGPLDQLPLAGDLGNTVGGVTDGVTNTLGGVTGGLGGLTGGQQQGGGGDAGKDTLRLRLDLNLDIEIQLKARIHGDLELSLLYVITSNLSFNLPVAVVSYLACKSPERDRRHRVFDKQRLIALRCVETRRDCHYLSRLCLCLALFCSCHDGTHVMLLLVQRHDDLWRRNMVFINDGLLLLLGGINTTLQHYILHESKSIHSLLCLCLCLCLCLYVNNV